MVNSINQSEFNIRDQLVSIALKWQEKYGVAPHITAAISEYDAAILVGCTEDEYSTYMQRRTAVSRGEDFIHQKIRYQVKANRPSGKRGSPVTIVAKAKNYKWDFLIWILYSTNYKIVEAWLWTAEDYKRNFDLRKRISPEDMRRGKKLK